MEIKSNNASSPKLTKPSQASNFSSAIQTTKRTGSSSAKGVQPQPFKLQTEERGQMKEQAFEKRLREMVTEEARRRIRIAQGLPLTTDKPQNLLKPAVKEQTKPLNIKLHTKERAARRAGFNELVASKNYTLEILGRFEEKIQKAIEEEQVKMMRKEMVPKAQLMPFFDRPFFPQRSSRRPTVPKEPSFLHKKCFAGSVFFSPSMKAIK